MKDLFDFVYLDNKAPKTLFLLHGTGGDKEDLLFLNDYLRGNYNLVGLEGNVFEAGMKRFFRRLAPGVFDEESIKVESEKLRQFIISWQGSYDLAKENSLFLGYSNGANILLAMLAFAPEVVNNLLLLHPMLPFSFESLGLDLSQHKIYLTTSDNDQMISAEESQAVAEALKKGQAQLIHKKYLTGHQISEEEIQDLTDYLNNEI